MADIYALLERMTPEAALGEIAAALRKLLPLVAGDGRLDFVKQIVGAAGDDQVASMVHL